MSPAPFADSSIAFINANSTIIAEVSDPPVDYFPQKNNECYDSGYSFHHYEDEFYYKGDEGAYLNVTGKRLNQDTLTSYFYIDNISLSCCPSATCFPEPEFTDTLMGCVATFTGSNSGDPGDYVWDFGDGGADTGMVVTHKFLWGDTFTVCLKIVCSDMETSQSVCHEIIIPDSCNVCDTLPGIRASRCDTNEVWMANFCFEVPKGFKACKDNNLFVSSPGVNISDVSYQIDVSNSLYDQVCVALQITVPAGYNFEQNGAAGHISLCTDGEVPMICRFFELYPQICDNCQAAVADTATCNDPDPNDQWRIYGGEITLTILDLNAQPCGTWSSESGFLVDPNDITSNGTTYTVPYTMTTTNQNLSEFSVLLCFIVGNQRLCVPVDIILPICGDPPQNCVREWGVKNMACSGIDGGGNAIVNITKSIHVGNHQLCAGGLFGTVDGGTVDVISSSVTLSGGVLNFSANIIIPCDSFVDGEIYEMRIYLCTEEGALECYLFPFRLYCDDCAQFGGGNRSQAFTERKNSIPINQYRIIPNPANDRVSVISTAFDADKRQEARLFNHMGVLIRSVYLSSEKTEIDISQCYPGIYYLVLSSNGVLVESEKLIIMR